MPCRIGPVILFSLGLHLVVPISTAGNAQHSGGDEMLLVQEGKEFLLGRCIKEVLSENHGICFLLICLKRERQTVAQFISYCSPLWQTAKSPVSSEVTKEGS